MTTTIKTLYISLAVLLPMCSSMSLFSASSRDYKQMTQNREDDYYDDDFGKEDYFLDQYFLDDDASDELIALRQKYQDYQLAIHRLLKKEYTQVPKDYENTLWHCLEFNQNNREYVEDDTVDCFVDTYEWDLDKLDPERMPKRCEGWDITPYYSQDMSLPKEEAEASYTDDYVEPCLWWHLWYGDFLPSAAPSQELTAGTTAPTTPRPSVNPTETSSQTPTAYPSTQPTPGPSSAPTSLPTDFPSSTPTSLPTLSPSTAVSVGPTYTLKPSFSPTRTFRPSSSPPTLSPTTAAPSTSPSEDLSDFPSRNLSSFVLTLTFSLMRKSVLNSQEENIQTEAMSNEVLRLTSAHLKDYLEAALGVNIVAIDGLESAYSERSRTYLMEVLEYGIIYFSPEDVVPTSQTLDLLVQSAFVGKALDDYVSLLQVEAIDPILQSTLYAEVVVDPTRDFGNGEKQLDDDEGSDFWTTGFITVIAAAGVACFSMIVLTYLLCTARARARRKFLMTTQKVSASTSNTSSEGDVQNPTPTQPPVNYDSDGTSVYSYVQHDPDDDVSLAPSFLNAMNDRSALGQYYDSNESSLEHSPHKFYTSNNEQQPVSNRLDEIVTSKLCKDEDDKILEMRTPNEEAIKQHQKYKEHRMKEFGALWDTVDDDSEENSPPNLFNDSASEEEEPPVFIHHKDKYAAPTDSHDF